MLGSWTCTDYVDMWLVAIGWELAKGRRATAGPPCPVTVPVLEGLAIEKSCALAKNDVQLELANTSQSTVTRNLKSLPVPPAVERAQWAGHSGSAHWQHRGSVAA